MSEKNENEMLRRSTDDPSVSINQMIKEADDREKREMLLVLQRLAEMAQGSITSQQLNNQMTLNLSVEVNKLSKQIDEIKEAAKLNSAEKKGMLGVINKFARPITIGLWSLTLAVGTWAFSKMNDTSDALRSHLAVSAALDEKRDEIDRELNSEMKKVSTAVAIMVEQHRGGK